MTEDDLNLIQKRCKRVGGCPPVWPISNEKLLQEDIPDLIETVRCAWVEIKRLKREVNAAVADHYCTVSSEWSEETADENVGKPPYPEVEED